MAKVKARTTGIKINALERRGQALTLRKSGASIRAIAQTLDVSTTLIAKDLNRALVELAQEEKAGVAELRTLELARLDSLLQTFYPKAVNGDYQAFDRVIKVAERRAKLLGLDMPVKVASTLSDGTDIQAGQWQEIRQVVFSALDSYPEARLLVAQRLSVLALPIPAAAAGALVEDAEEGED